MTIKDALYRELKYGPALVGLVSPSNIKLDMRNSVSSTKSESAYPYVLFRRITSSENNQVRVAGERFEIEAIGLRSSGQSGDDTLEAIRTALLNAYVTGKGAKWGAYDEDGTPNPSQGVGLKCHYISTVEGYSEDFEEKSHIHIFRFTFLRS
jgi:hypothetical protein